jgi:hypothetical protein
MKIILSTFPTSEFAKIQTYSTVLKRLEWICADELLVTHIQDGGNHETFQAVLAEDQNYNDLLQAQKEIKVTRKLGLKHRKKNETVDLELTPLVTKWIQFYLVNRDEIRYRYGLKAESYYKENNEANLQRNS